MKLALWIINFVLDILYPEFCFGCGKRGIAVCPTCIKSLPETVSISNKNFYAGFQYHNPLTKKLIWNLKYYHRKSLGNILGHALYTSYVEELSDMILFSQTPLIIIPVPLSKERQKTRGYNQALRIAQGFSQHILPSNAVIRTDIVIKEKNTIPQATLRNKTRRLKNMTDAFRIKNKKAVSGKTVIIIDDVTTTGATFNEIRKVLEEAQVKKIISFAVAH